MLGQLFAKVITFFINSILFRYLSPRIVGITSFLEFIQGTVLFFSREAIRLSALRINTRSAEYGVSTSHDNVLQTAANLAHVSMWIGLPLSIALISWQYTNMNSFYVSLPLFHGSLLCIWISIILELAMEPLYVVNQLMLNYGTRSRFEGLAVTIGCTVHFCIVYGFHNQMLPFWFLRLTHIQSSSYEQEIWKEGTAILAFSIGKLAHSLTLLLCYSYDYWRNIARENLCNWKLTKIKDKENSKVSYYFHKDITEHFKKVYFQLCFKHLLGEGDKLIINSLCTIEEQGIYSMLSNYGSLVTRLLFAPIEESLRLFLTRLLAEREKKKLNLSMDVLANLIKFYTYLSIPIIIFGPLVSPFLLQFIIGSKWSTTSLLGTIRVYCFYIPFLAMNGIFEAFFQSVASGDEILKHSYFMMCFSGIFLFDSWVFIELLDLSIYGLIISNIISMVLRIVYCWKFILNFYDKLDNEHGFYHRFQHMKPVLWLSLLVATFDWILIGHVKNFHQFTINVLLAMILVGLMVFEERAAIKELLRGRFSPSGTSEKMT